MNLNTFAMYQKNLLNVTFALFLAVSAAFGQGTTPAPSAPAGAPSSTTPSGSQGNGTTQGQSQQQGNTRSVTLPNGQVRQVPVNSQGNVVGPDGQVVQTTTNAQGEVVPVDPQSQTENSLKTAEETANDQKRQARIQAEFAKQELRQSIFGYSLFADSAFSPIPEQSIGTPSDYTIGPGDNLTLSIYGYAQYPDQELEVNRDGDVNILRVGVVNLAGKTIQEAQKILMGRFSKFVPGMLGSGGNASQTKLLLTLGKIRPVNVFVTGEVVRPGSYTLNSLSSAFNALYFAGGPNEIGTFREIRVIRSGKVVSTFDIYDILLNGTSEGAIRIQDNDIVNVGFVKKRIEITGNVRRPKLYEAKGNEKLGDIIRYAGGFTDNAYRARVTIRRISDNGERRILDVKNAEFDNFELVSGDVIEVQAILNRFENIVFLEGAVMRPGDYSIDSNPTLKTLLENAQGLREDAFTGRITVMRTRADQTVQNIPLNLKDIMNGEAEDLLLTRLDRIIIPSNFDMVQPSYVQISGEVNNIEEPEANDPTVVNGPDVAATTNSLRFPYMSNMTLEDLILMGGGFKESAKASQVEVIRRVRNSDAKAADANISEHFEFDVSRDLSLDGNDTNFPLYPFDEVIVRKSPNYQEQQYVILQGEVLNPGQYAIVSKNDKVSDLVMRAGGLTDLAYVKGATLIRSREISEFEAQQTANALGQISTEVRKGSFNVATGGEIRQEFVGIQLEKILKNPDSEENIIIQEGDILSIPKRLETVRVQGALLYPNTVKYSDDMNFLDYISQAGGFTRTSLRRSAYIKYPNGSVDRTRRFLMFNVYPKVEPGSEIYVPVKGAASLTPQQILQQGISITSTLFTLILSVLAFRNIR
ncbi:SLBB domain-containing protein [Persicitalea jodogahamensis]|uniref:Capsule polysaccharide transporter n=1 Tax=Persicitalea jodogahamensis TaxID=402147 RepID=A0A8J3G9K0_9BACT|nr:SLBB domain-containing protein [Persicitalea jodogahamensis]GHB75879.1 capsule polysaccharide transporter [Persicitalea jodogahamensis]